MLQMYIEGGIFMHPILVCLVLGVAFSIERFIFLNRSTINTRQFVSKVIDALDKSGVKQAIEVCEKTKGPVASIFHAGLLRAGRGAEHVEKAISNAGSIEMAFLERGLIWISTFISLAPMLGFTGTVQGMIVSFQDIKKANDISPSIVANGISIALLTTLFGLIVAMLLQACYNYFFSKIDRLVIDMEMSSEELMDHLIEIPKNK